MASVLAESIIQQDYNVVSPEHKIFKQLSPIDTVSKIDLPKQQLSKEILKIGAKEALNPKLLAAIIPSTVVGVSIIVSVIVVCVVFNCPTDQAMNSSGSC